MELGIAIALGGGIILGYIIRWVLSPTRSVYTDPLDIPYASCGHCATLVSAYCKDHRAEHAAEAMGGWR